MKKIKFIFITILLILLFLFYKIYTYTNNLNIDINSKILDFFINQEISVFFENIEINDVVKKVSSKNEIVEVIKEDNKPLIYIYNTHQTEQYYYNKNEPYNIIPTVLTTSYMLQEQFINYNIKSIVEERSIKKLLNENKWNYSGSYLASRVYLEDTYNNNKSLKYFIDVHRDSVNRNISTITIDNKTYARVLFIIGLENKNYKNNLIITEYINNKINENYKGLSRGIYKKKGENVNGIYNQDFNSNCILIEFGSEENTIDEVYNSVVVISKIIANYIGEQNET